MLSFLKTGVKLQVNDTWSECELRPAEMIYQCGKQAVFEFVCTRAGTRTQVQVLPVESWHMNTSRDSLLNDVPIDWFVISVRAWEQVDNHMTENSQLSPWRCHGDSDIPGPVYFHVSYNWQVWNFNILRIKENIYSLVSNKQSQIYSDTPTAPPFTY